MSERRRNIEPFDMIHNFSFAVRKDFRLFTSRLFDTLVKSRGSVVTQVSVLYPVLTDTHTLQRHTRDTRSVGHSSKCMGIDESRLDSSTRPS